MLKPMKLGNIIKGGGIMIHISGLDDRYDNLESVLRELENLIDERNSMEACIEETIVALQRGDRDEALDVLRHYQKLEIVNEYFEGWPGE